MNTVYTLVSYFQLSFHYMYFVRKKGGLKTEVYSPVGRRARQ